MYAGGRFEQVTNASGSHRYDRRNLMAFDASTGAMRTSFAPRVSGDVWAIVTTKRYVYIGGAFSVRERCRPSRDRQARPLTGRVIGRFHPHLGGGWVTDMAMVHGKLIVGGSFPRKIIALNRRTGANTDYIKVAVTGNVGDGATQIFGSRSTRPRVGW